jgi:hypothetical protein
LLNNIAGFNKYYKSIFGLRPVSLERKPKIKRETKKITTA